MSRNTSAPTNRSAGAKPKLKLKPQPRPAATAGRKPPQGAGEVRIIGGQWKRTRLKVTVHPGLRPTPDRVRETLFNWLGQDLQGWRCLDAFAGTGALGLEAASRGAAAVLLVEQDAALAAQLTQQVQRLQAQNVQVQRADGLQAIARGQNLDVIFIDPPFGEAAWFAPALQAAARAIAPQGFVYLEAPQRWDEAALAAVGLVLWRHLKAGAVHAHLLRLAPSGAV